MCAILFPLMGLLFLLFIGALIWVALGSLAIIHRLTHPPRMTYGVAVARDLPTSPAEVGLDFTEAVASLPDGNTSPVWIVKGENAQGPAVILTHGWKHSRLAVVMWMKQLAPFVSKIIAYDMRGHGESSAPTSRLGTAEVDDLLNIARQFLADEKAIVFAGQSMGGGITIAAVGKVFEQNLTAELPVVGILVDGAYRLGMQPVEGYFRQQGMPLWPFWLPVAGHLSFWYTRASQFDRAMHAAKLRCPLLAMHGELDEVCVPQASKDIVAAAAKAGNWASYVEFPKAGHLNLAEVDAGRYREALTDFFKQIPSAESHAQTNSQSSTPSLVQDKAS